MALDRQKEAADKRSSQQQQQQKQAEGLLPRMKVISSLRIGYRVASLVRNKSRNLGYIMLSLGRGIISIGGLAYSPREGTGGLINWDWRADSF